VPLTSKLFIMQPDSYHDESTSSPSYASNLPPLQPMESLFPNQPVPPIRYNQPQVIESTAMLTAWNITPLTLLKHINDVVTVLQGVLMFS
jgi:hypothetical protein